MKTLRISVLALALCALVLPDRLIAQTAESQATLLEETEALGRELELVSAEIGELMESVGSAEGEDLLIVEARIRRRGKRIRESLGPFVTGLVELRNEGRDVTELQAKAEGILSWAFRLLRRELERCYADTADLRKKRDGGEAGDALTLEQELTRYSVDIDNALKTLADIFEYREALGLDVSDDFEFLDDLLQERAETLAGRANVAERLTSDLRDTLSKATEDEKANINPQLPVVQERLHRATTSLGTTVRMMDARGLETAEYKQILISSSGQITTDILDIRVASGLIRSWWDATKTWFSIKAPQFIFKLLLLALILTVFRFLGRMATRLVTRAMARAEQHVPQLLKNMAISFTSKAILMLGILIALSQVGIEIGPLLAGVGVAGFILGFALQETLSNFASGLMILLYQPFDVGDAVEAGGVSGKVYQMSLVSTTILTFDNQKLIVPNNKIWGDVIRNKTAEDTRRVDMVFGISYADDIDRTERVLAGIIEAHDLIIEDPVPMIRLHELGDSSVNFIVRPWTKTEDYWTVFWDVTRAVKKRFDEEGISIPFPQRDVHVYKEAVTEAPKDVQGRDPAEHFLSGRAEDMDESGGDDAEN